MGKIKPAPERGARNSHPVSLRDYVQQGYRPDIDGLRAIAVLAVIAYHFGIGPTPGGFIGVDIFFVISGFLITGVIVEKLEIETFSFADFYQRRIRRIFPALIPVLLVVLGGLTVLEREELFRVSVPFGVMFRSVTAGAAFFMNFTLQHTDDYFHQTASAQPLLHLWSLAIEEQFYIVWPLLLFGMRRVRVKYLPVTLAIATASFAINVVTVRTDPNAAFYSPLSRTWELMIGAALAYFPTARLDWWIAAGVRAAIGLGLIGIGLFAIKNGPGFPGWFALVPTVGAALVISAGPNALLNRSLLGAKSLTWIGLISYPLYLWHWPALLLFQRYTSFFEALPFGRPAFKVVVLLGTTAASWLTFRFVEVPFRFGAWRDALGAGALAVTMATIALIGAFAPGIVPYSLTPYQRETIAAFRQVEALGATGALYGDRMCFRWERSATAAMFLKNKCLEPKFANAKVVLLIGDSHSASLSLGLRPLVEQYGVNFLQVSTAWCGAPTSENFDDAHCREVSDLVTKKIVELRPDLVILDAHWVPNSIPPYFVGDSYSAHLIATLDDLLRKGAKRIIIIGEIPTWQPTLPERLALDFVLHNESIPRRTFFGVDSDSLRMDTTMRAIEYPSAVTYLSLRDVLCNAAGCLTSVGPDLDHDLVVWDYGHLTEAASNFVAHALIEPVLSEILKPPSPAVASHDGSEALARP